MPVKFEDELRQRAAALVDALLKCGIDAAIILDSFRDYQVKVAVGQMGKLVIYFSPKKQAHTLRTHELRQVTPEVRDQIQRCWVTMDAPQPDRAQPAGTIAYVDGSYIDGGIGWGWAVIDNGAVIAEAWGEVTDPNLQGMRQVSGEMQAVLELMAWCEVHEVHQITIVYDYKGLEAWATGAWKAGKPATKAYAEAARSWPVTVHWEKVKSHSNDRWNDYVDGQAKQGARGTQPVDESACSLTDVAVETAMGFVSFAKDHSVDIDVYNTKKRPPDRPYVHGFRDSTLQAQITALWRAYLAGEAPDHDPARDWEPPGPLQEASHYYQILQPFGDCDFDFTVLAQALASACQRLGYACPGEEELRFDFEALETLYQTLQRRTR